MTKMPKYLLVVAAVLLVAAACFYYFMRVHAPSAPPVVDKTALIQLRADMQKVSPRFIDASEANGQSLTPEEKKIKDDVVALFSAGQPGSEDYYSQIWLDAVGKRYILLSQPSAESSHDIILDSQTGMTAPIGGDIRFYLASKGRNVALYINTQDLYTYTLDQSSGVLVSGSKLSGSQTYNSGAADMLDVNPIESHSINSITISVFDTTRRVPNPALGKGATMNGKVREVTVTF